MRIGNFARQFVRDVRAQKLRLVLTIFGIVWGTAAVTLLLAFGEGLQKRVVRAQKGLGDAIVIAWPMRTTRTWEGLPRGRQIRMVSATLARASSSSWTISSESIRWRESAVLSSSTRSSANAPSSAARS